MSKLNDEQVMMLTSFGTQLIGTAEGVKRMACKVWNREVEPWHGVEYVGVVTKHDVTVSRW
jgi:hypothetical protein